MTTLTKIEKEILKDLNKKFPYSHYDDGEPSDIELFLLQSIKKVADESSREYRKTIRETIDKYYWRTDNPNSRYLISKIEKIIIRKLSLTNKEDK